MSIRSSDSFTWVRREKLTSVRPIIGCTVSTDNFASVNPLFFMMHTNGKFSGQ
jgi:hypothetical protein